MRGTARGQVQSHYKIMVRTVKKIAVYCWKEECECSACVCVRVCVYKICAVFFSMWMDLYLKTDSV